MAQTARTQSGGFHSALNPNREEWAQAAAPPFDPQLRGRRSGKGRRGVTLPQKEDSFSRDVRHLEELPMNSHEFDVVRLVVDVCRMVLEVRRQWLELLNNKKLLSNGTLVDDHTHDDGYSSQR